MATVTRDFTTRSGVKAGGVIEGTTLKSSVSTGTAPLTVASTTKVDNLNADLLDGMEASAFASATSKLSAFAATTSSELAGVISDETGSGALVFGTSPQISTSLTTDSATFALVNTTATTVNFAGAATALSIGAATGTTTVNNNLTVSGDLVVNGTTTTINSTTQTLDDPIFTLGGNTAPESADSKDRGIEFRYHTGSSAKMGFFGFDDSTGYFTFIPDASNSSEVFSGTPGDIQATNFRGALIGNADTATTAGKWTTARSVSLTGVVTGTVNVDGSENVSITTSVGTVTSLPLANSTLSSDTVTVDTNSTPTAVDTFDVATYSSADYFVQAKQGTKMTATHVTVMWDGTDVQVAEWGYVEATAGAANVTFTATYSSGTVTVSASSPDATTTSVVVKSSVTYIEA